MNFKSLKISLLAIGVLLNFGLMAQEAVTKNYIKKIKTSANQLTIETDHPGGHFLLEIAGPDGFFYKKEIKSSQNIQLESQGLENLPFADGRYTVQLTPVVLLQQKEQKILRYLLAEEKEKAKAAEILAQLPDQVEKFAHNFSIEAGNFVLPRREQAGLQLPQDDAAPNLSTFRGKLKNPNAKFTNLFGNPRAQFVDQVFLDDVIVDGSLCLGQDCVNGESFGFDTQRIKENNVRIHFDDTSSSASFPSNDWRLKANDTTNGGDNYFGIEDATAGRQVFTIKAGARANALLVATNGFVGLGTSVPAKAIHTAIGDTPTLRLDQDGTAGYAPQVWDIGGNESNLFFKDVTNNSTITFKIAAGAPAGSIEVAADGSITTFGTITQGSDMRLKQNISALGSMLPILNQLKPQQYHYRQDNGFSMSKTLQFGLIAQDVQEVLPNLVSNINEGTVDKPALKGINYVGLIPILVKGVQEQQTIIDQQNEKIAILEKQMATMESEITEVKQLKAELQELIQSLKTAENDQK